jgi:putative solute:sodium symporter small subunit
MNHLTTTQQKQYWQTNLRLTVALLSLWFSMTFIVSFYASELNALTFLEFPLGYYMTSQGSLLIYLAIVWFYARYMKKLDQAYGLDDEN